LTAYTSEAFGIGGFRELGNLQKDKALCLWVLIKDEFYLF